MAARCIWVFAFIMFIWTDFHSHMLPIGMVDIREKFEEMKVFLCFI